MYQLFYRFLCLASFSLQLGLFFLAPPSFAGTVSVGLDHGVLRVVGTDDPDTVTFRLQNTGSQMIEILDLAVPTSYRFPVSEIVRIEAGGGGGDDRIVLDREVAALGLPIEINGGAGNDRIVAIVDLPRLAVQDFRADREQVLGLAQEIHELSYEGLLAELPGFYRQIHSDLVERAQEYSSEGQALIEETSRQRLDDTLQRLREVLDLFAALSRTYIDRTARFRYEIALATLNDKILPSLEQLTTRFEVADADFEDYAEEVLDSIDAELEVFFDVVEGLDAGVAEDDGAEDGVPPGSSDRDVSRLARKLFPDVEKAAGPLAEEPAFDPAGAEALAARIESELLDAADRLMTTAEERFAARAEEVSRLAEQLLEQATAIAERAAVAEPPGVDGDLLTPMARLASFNCNVQSQISISGDDGDDWLIGTLWSDSISGGAGSDVIFGWGGADLIHGNEDGDVLFGGGGGDEIHGDDGFDIAFGGGGGDCIYGEADSDVLFGQAGEDAMDGGADLDVMLGGADDDLMHGGDGPDVMLGNRDNDTMRGQDDIDVMFGDLDLTPGGQDSDTMFGGDGRIVSGLSNVDLHIGNLMFGNQGVDDMHGGDGIDAMFGDRDGDTMRGGEQVDFMWGGAGDDEIFGDQGGVLFTIQGVPVRLGNLMFGNRDDDAITGGPDLDVAFGNRGSDSMVGGDGSSVPLGIDSDFLFGNQHDDVINGGRGHDFIFGNRGDDDLRGDSGSGGLLDPSFDVIFGNQGDDRIDGGRNLDLLFGNQGEDVIDGSGGWDLIFGNQDDDQIDGGRGWDLIFGNRGCDRISGGRGWDLIFGNQGLDKIDGGKQWDLIFGNRGPDTIQGGDGWDLIFGNRGHDVVDGGRGFDLLLGGQDNDIVIGSSGWNLHFGLSGDDSLLGGDRVDVMFGNEGEDCLEGGDGIDVMFGNRDADQMRGDRKTDLMLGGRGDDEMLGGRGWDVMCGGRGNDVIRGGPGLDLLRGNAGNNDVRQFGGSDLEIVCNRPARRCIRGIKFHDFNGNGVRDSGEPTLPGWTITATGSDGESRSTVTGSDGSYAFCNLPSDCYEVEETVQSGWGATTPIVQLVELSAVQDETDVDFGNRQPPPAVGEPRVDYDQACDRSGGSNGRVTIPVTGGTRPFTCSGSPGSGQPIDTPGACVFVGVPAGTHLYTVSIVGGPTVTLPVTVEATVAITAVDLQDPSPQASCQDGSIEIDVFSQSSDLSVRWFDQTRGEDLDAFEDQLKAENLDPGTYVVTVTDENRCYASERVTLRCDQIPDLEILEPDIEYEDACDRSGGNRASVTLTIEGGVGPFFCNYLGSGLPDREADGRTCTLNGLARGSYTFIVFDAGRPGTEQTVDVEVEKRIRLAVTGTDPDNSTCDNGSATVGVEGGQPPYTVRWTPGGQTEQTAVDLRPGTYEVLVTDNQGCYEIGEVTLECDVTQELQVLDELTFIEECDRNSGRLAKVTLNIEGGVGPFRCDYQGNDPPGQEADGRQCVFGPLPLGTYSFVITDTDSGKKTTAEVVIQEPIQLDFNTDCAAGSVSVTPTGGQPPYLVRWTPGDLRGDSVEGLEPGAYKATVSDDNGCFASAEVILRPCDCPDASDPEVFYLSEDLRQCPELIPCRFSQSSFRDACGCGCIERGIGPVERPDWTVRLHTA